MNNNWKENLVENIAPAVLISIGAILVINQVSWGGALIFIGVLFWL